MATIVKSKYIDGFVLCVPKNKIAAYKSLGETSTKQLRL